ncbi:SUMF1/EgtB/PvdO family nonheme iron enzyme [Pedobacter glucosidilyticus]|uniref:SUMF1/EgtB/PvdO family nonheme iron enzyme n=1 Tax=Pedobacter glucosidilyticus TaxID=1122941 RepID=UPI0026ED7AEF|nr:SUMF1/EgtB/PvdO family nonheme iron enzyme [Pedobacter glucosidilyticus]
MKKVLFTSLLIMFVGTFTFANNLIMGVPSIGGSTVSFTIKWDNSWKVSAGPANWDAVWVFVKRQNCDQPNQNPWLHGQLAASGHSVTGTQLQVDLPTDQMGVFIRRNADGIGNINEATVTLTLSSPIGADNIGVYGIEMVNVPEGEFFIGDGNNPSSTNRINFTDGATDNPLRITAAIQAAGIGAATVYQKSGFGSIGSLPATFPLGYNSFYCMKYEITTGQYVSFLNSLTYNQQLRLQEDPNATPPSSPIGTVINARFGYRIEIKTPGISTTSLTPAIYGNDATDDNNFDQENDGIGLPVSIRVKDFLAFLDWAALRPMTEFEYEKASRGPLTPVLNEYSWGTTDLRQFNNYAVNNRFTSSEVLSGSGLGMANVGSNTLYRVGITATPISDRLNAGATYYGIMDMTGSVFERCIGGLAHNYAAFTTANGNGQITTDSFADVIGWPLSTEVNTYETYYPRRGGSCNRYEGIGISNRQWSNFSDGNRDFASGGRGVRSF